jgi:hypothetical protein
LSRALDRALGITFAVFESQVVPFLAPDHQEIYGTPEAWERICELVVDRLSGLTG